MAEPILKLENIRVWFPVKRGLFRKPMYVKAVDGVDLELPRGGCVTVVGESGCGKTTLGRAAIGLVKPTSGRILYKGRDIHKLRGRDFMEFRRNAQIIHQDPYTSLNPTKTVFAILQAPLKRWGYVRTRKEAIEKVSKLLELVGLVPPEEYLFRYPHQLSGGERQRVSIARAISIQPEIIVADEAVSAVDASIRVEIMDLLLKFQKLYGISYIFITHDLAVARYFTLKSGGEIAVMYLGKIVERAPLDKVIREPLHPYTQALLQAVPTMDLEKAAKARALPLRSLEVPSPLNPPPGCRFHPRCPYAMDICSSREPELIEVKPRHYVACWLYSKR